MSQADELSKLLELKDRGAITQAEYNAMKRKVLNGGAKSSRFVTIVAGVVAFMILAGLGLKAYESFSGQGRLACDDTDVLTTAAEVSNRVVRGLAAELAFLNPGGGAEDSIIRSISGTKTHFVDQSDGFIVCTGDSHTNAGVKEIGYTVRWIDKSAGKYEVQLESPSDIRQRYSAK